MTKAKKVKKRKTKSVLSSQKPKRNRKRFNKILLFSLASLILVGLALGLTYQFYKGDDSVTKTTTKKIDYKLSLKVDGDRPLSAKTAENILKVASKNLGTASREDLQKVAKLVQVLGSFSSVRALSVSPDAVVISVKRRVPLLLVKADKMRFLSNKSVVYGETNEEEIDQLNNEMPILEGVFDKHRYTFADDNSLSTTDEEKNTLLEAVKLHGAGQETGFYFKSITYQKYRGFSIVLRESDLNVSIGRPPYKQKLLKLRKILAQLEKKGSHAERIELDYHGKAFVKEKKL